MAIKGQANYRSSKAVRDAACFGDNEALRRVLTIRGRTGAVLAIKLIKSEEATEIAQCLEEVMSVSARNQVHYLTTDSPSHKLMQHLKVVLPSLKGILLDSVHLAIVYEYAQWRKRTPGSKVLRRLLHRFTQVDFARQPSAWGPFFDGSYPLELTREESRWRSQIKHWTRSESHAKNILEKIEVDDSNKPILTRVTFIEGIAAICALRAKEVERKVTRYNKEVRGVLWSACAPERLEWLFNNQRARHAMSNSQIALLPSGTTSNESLHAEINSWTRVNREVHRSTLHLKLNSIFFGKQLGHHIATFYPHARQTPEGLLIARGAAAPLWEQEHWNANCFIRTEHGKKAPKSSCPFHRSRQIEVAKVRAWNLKKPAATKSRRKKRTPHTVRRESNLQRAGVKRKTL